MSSSSDKCLKEQECTHGSPNHEAQSPRVMSEETVDISNEEVCSDSYNSFLNKALEADQEGFLESMSMVEDKSDGSPNLGVQLQEETPVAPLNGKEENESVKILKEKLSAALINVSLKDELVKQHAKVAEEAVDGWEKAETEAASMKQQLDAAVEQNSILEARSNHLDQALKECVRQLRLAKEEKERKISEALTEKGNEYELSKSMLKSQIVELEAQLKAFSAPEIHLKLEFLERENQSLKQELMSQSEELEIRTIERDLSTKAAETASKQHLESIKMVARLESESRRLKSHPRKQHLFNNGQRSPSASSYSIDLLSNGQSDCSEVFHALEEKPNGQKPCEHAGSDLWATALIVELDHFKNEKSSGKIVPSSLKIDLMDDFLEMEKLASMPENSICECSDCPKVNLPERPSTGVEITLREELKVILCKAAELEEKVRKLEAEKAELEMASAQSRMCLESVQVELIETRMKFEQLEAELQEVNELKMDYESYVNDLKLESQAMVSKIESLEGELDRQRVSTENLSARCQELENDLCRKNEELDLQKDLVSRSQLEEKEKALAESDRRLDELQIQIKEAVMKLEKQNAAYQSEFEEKEMTLVQSQGHLVELQTQLNQAQLKLGKLQKELDEANESNLLLENELLQKSIELELQKDALSISQLEEKEKALLKSHEHVNELQTQIKEAVMKLEKQDAASRLELEQKERELDEARKCLDELQIQLKEAGMRLEKQSTAYNSKFEEKELDLAENQERLNELERQLGETEMKLEKLQKELDRANESEQCLKSDLAEARGEVETTSAKLEVLLAQIAKEQAISAKLSANCAELEKGLKQREQELKLRQSAHSHIEQKINQEDLAGAAGKLAECQKTIASLGNQLKSLATLEDFLIDTASIPGFSGSAPLITKGGNEMWKLHSNNVYLSQKKYGDHLQAPQEVLHTFLKYDELGTIEPSASTPFHCSGSESPGTGFEKLFPMRRS